MQAAAADLTTNDAKMEMRHLLALAAIASGTTWLAASVAAQLPPLPPVLSESTDKILLVTSCGLLLSFSPARRIPGSHTLAMALVYLFVAMMDARVSIDAMAGQGIPFVAGAYL